VRNGRISTSGLKSDAIIVFVDPSFPCDAKILVICVRLKHTTMVKSDYLTMGVLADGQIH